MRIRLIRAVVKLSLVESHERGALSHPWYSPRYCDQQYNVWEDDDRYEFTASTGWLTDRLRAFVGISGVGADPRRPPPH